MDVLGTVHNSFDGAWKEMHVMLHFFTIPRIITFYDEGETKATHVLVCHGDHVATTTESSVIIVGEVVIRRFHVLSPRPRKEEVKMRIPVKPTSTKPVTSERKWLFCLNVEMKWIRWVWIIGNEKPEMMMMIKWILLRKYGLITANHLKTNNLVLLFLFIDGFKRRILVQEHSISLCDGNNHLEQVIPS